MFQQRSSIERGCSSNGRALALHARGTGFDPPHLHFFFLCPQIYAIKMGMILLVGV